MKLSQKLKYGFRMFLSRLRPDSKWLDKNVPISKIAGHANYLNYLTEIGNKKGMRILEVGSREVTGKSDARQRFSNAEYVGFDYYAGPNVDVVGDAHKLSQYFGEQRFDIIYSSACFEHFAMPWLVSVEMAKVLKVGGIVFVETHFSFCSQQRPWHFFQLSDMALRVLFSPAIGIECIEAGMSNPMVARFTSSPPNTFGSSGSAPCTATANSSAGRFPWPAIFRGAKSNWRRSLAGRSTLWTSSIVADVVPAFAN